MKRKWMAGLLCLLMVLQLAASPATAVGDVYFLAAEENVQPLSDTTMPFWRNNYLYIPSTLFAGTARDSLQVGSTQSSDGSWVALYWGERALLYKKGLPYGEDQNGKRYYPGVEEQNGILFVPAGPVADMFGLRYSVQRVPNGSLVWLRSRDFILTEDAFVDAAASVLEQRYADYKATQTLQEPQLPELPTPPVEELIYGKRLYICLQANEETPQILDILSRYNSRMTFFCTPDFMEEQDDLLRRMVGEGHGVGILAEEGEGLPSVEEQLRRANEALLRATCSKTRLVRVENGSPETISRLLTEGYCPAASNLKRSSAALRSSAQAEELFRTMTTMRGAAVAWLGDSVHTAGLVAFLAKSVRADDPCVALNETVHIA